jgi:DNA recombination protein RmuC
MTSITLAWLAASAVLFFTAGFWFGSKRRTQSLDQVDNPYHLLLENLKRDKASLQQQLVELQQVVVQAERDKASSTAKQQLMEQRLVQMQQEMKEQFENLANRIFEDKGKSLMQQSEKNLDSLLSPLRDRLGEFQKKVEDAYQFEARERHALKVELQKIVDAGARLGDEAHNLTKALKGDVKAQGNWGEVMLERILQSSGLRDGDEYITQGRGLNLSGDEGQALKPDVLIRLPEDKHLVVDAKVSLVSYERYSASEQKAEQEQHARDFLRSVYQHVDGLAGKKYHMHEKLASPEFTLLFFPIEGALSMALTLDRELFQYAWDKGIVIVGPTTILATLKTVAGLWKQERQNKNALQIASEAGKLYDKFLGLIEEWQKIGDSLSKTQELYQNSMSKLRDGRGNLISRVEKIRLLGAKTSRQLDDDQMQVEQL